MINEGEESKYQVEISLAPEKLAIFRVPGTEVRFGSRYDEVTWLNPAQAESLLIDVSQIGLQSATSNSAA